MISCCEKCPCLEKALPWIVVFTASLFFFFQFIQMNVFNSISQDLMVTFHLSSKGMGFLSSLMFYANALMLLPAGMMLDRMSIKRLMMINLSMMIVSLVWFSVTKSLCVAEFCRFVMGLNSAFCFLSCLKLAIRWFPPERMALVTGLVDTVDMIGGTVAQTPMVMLVEASDWRTALFFNVLAGVICLWLIASLVRNSSDEAHKKKIHPLCSLAVLILMIAALAKYGLIWAHDLVETLIQYEVMGALPWVSIACIVALAVLAGMAACGQKATSNPDSGTDFWSSLKKVLTNRQNWLGGLYTCLLNLPIVLVGGLWGTQFLMNNYHLTSHEASSASAMVFVGTIFGSPILGWWSDSIKQRRLPMILGAIASLVWCAWVLYGPWQSYHLLLIGYFILGFITSMQVISYPLIAESNPNHISGTSLALGSILIIGGGAVFQNISGCVIEFFAKNTPEIAGIVQYSGADYLKMMSLMIIGMVVALFFAWGIRETHSKVYEEGLSLTEKIENL